MTERTRNRTPEEDAEAKAREAAFEAWRPGEPKAPEEPEVIFTPPRQKFTFPPSFLFIVAASCVLFAIEPTVDLRYELLGPSQAVDLGAPANYHLDAARDGARVHIKGYLGSLVKTVEPWVGEHEVGVLKGVPVLVRRPRHPAPPPDTVQVFEGEGRLVQLEGTPSTFFDRMVNPASRFNTLRLQYEAIGELSKDGPAWLLLEGDLPRAHPTRIALPFILWTLAIVCSVLGWRSHAARSTRPASRRRIGRA